MYHVLGHRDDTLIEFRLLFSITDDSSVTLSLSIEEEGEEERGETEGLLLPLHLPRCNYTNNNT